MRDLASGAFQDRFFRGRPLRRHPGGQANGGRLSPHFEARVLNQDSTPPMIGAGIVPKFPPRIGLVRHAFPVTPREIDIMLERSFFVVLSLVASAAPALAAAPGRAAKTPPAGFTVLFNGKDFTGWHAESTMDPRLVKSMDADAREKFLKAGAADLSKHWKVRDGVIVNDGQGAYLTTDKDYGDFELLVEFKIGPKGDSGVYLKGTPQVQIWDFTEPSYARMGASKGSGGLWNNAEGAPGKDPLVVADRPIGEWNQFRIIMVGERTTVYLNDKLVVDHARLANYWKRSLPLLARAPIQLQTHDHEVLWRGIAVRELEADEANAILAAHGKGGFTPIFDGKTLEGWKGATAGYHVKEGAIQCRPGSGGTLYYEKELSDFAARVEFKLPPAGNNGLAIRYPGEGDTAYVGMTELQILDDGHPNYAGRIDPRQACGSAYGMVPAHRGYLRPTGQWNFEEVTVKGSTIKVELNGTQILDADLSKVKEFMAKSAHPGKDRKSGFFGFAGHGDPVQFKSVFIKPLP